MSCDGCGFAWRCHDLHLLLHGLTVRLRHCVVAGLNRGGCSGGVAVVAVDDPETGGRILHELGVRRFAHLAGDKLLDVFSEQTLDVLVLERPFQGQLSTLSNRAFCTKLGEHEEDDVVLWSLHQVANLPKVLPTDLLGADAHDFGRLKLVLRGRTEGGVLLLDDAVEPGEEFVVLVDSALLAIDANHLGRALIGLLLLLFLLLLLLFLLLGAEVELLFRLVVSHLGWRRVFLVGEKGW
mmetsp:Transcript_29238/g.62143  ORF Transcript_29238/g.62143 Transcript_29238/m.62143 type:complete len:238 (+) Transcript_29238:63-776(+)